MKHTKHTKRFVILDTGAIIDLATFGMESWGSNNQYSVEIIDNKVYATYWSYGSRWEEDTDDKILLGSIVYQSDKPFYITESDASSTIKKTDYAEYGADLERMKQKKLAAAVSIKFKRS